MSASFQELVNLSQSAIHCQATGKWDSAAQIWQRILQEDPGWESGDGWYNLGVCLENLHRPMDARTPYLRALANYPWNTIFLETWAAWCADYATKPEQLDAGFRFFVGSSSSAQLETPFELPQRVAELAKELGVGVEEIQETLVEMFRAKETGEAWPELWPKLDTKED